MVKKISYGKKPELILHTGTHGDEWEVIDLVYDAIKKHERSLPPFLFVPEVSPSAVRLRTRLNGNGQDMNRIFFSDSREPEVLENMKIVEGKKFNLMVTFHEDPEISKYYIYDVCRDPKNTEAILRHLEKIKSAGIELFTGVDDPNDEALGYEFVNGYRKFSYEEDKDSGMVTVWMLNHGIIKDCMIPEIPGKLSLEKKKFIVDSFFEEVLIQN